MKKILSITLCLMFLGIARTNAQDLGQILAGSLPDANKYLTNYMEPFGKGEILNMGRGWFNTARVHKPLGFDITIGAQLALVPDNKQTFVFNNSDFSTFKLKTGTSGNLQTFLGDKTTQVITVNTSVSGKPVSYEFNSIAGIGADMKKNLNFTAVPLPVIQVGLGLFKHTELKARYFPTTDFSGTQIGVFGAAIQHEFDYLPFLKRAPFFHLAALAGYNSVTTTYDMTKNSGIAGSNQKAELKINAFTLQAIASVKLSILEIYTALGYTSGTSNVNMNGTYTVNYKDASTGVVVPGPTLTNPIAVSYSNSGISNTWGARLNLFFLKVFADYTIASTYNGVGAGVSLSIR